MTTIKIDAGVLDRIKRDLIEGFPFDKMDSDAALERCRICEEAGLLIMLPTEKGSFDEQEYGEYVFRLTELGRKLQGNATAQPQPEVTTEDDKNLIASLRRRQIYHGGYDPDEPDKQCIRAAQRIEELIANLGTEISMHQAWRKRAEEAESATLLAPAVQERDGGGC